MVNLGKLKSPKINWSKLWQTTLLACLNDTFLISGVGSSEIVILKLSQLQFQLPAELSLANMEIVANENWKLWQIVQIIILEIDIGNGRFLFGKTWNRKSSLVFTIIQL